MTTQEQVDQLREDVEAIKARNKRVEAEKGWETSIARRLAITITTYALAVFFLYIIGNTQPLLNAIIPALAFLFSTTSLGILKSWWIKKNTH